MTDPAAPLVLEWLGPAGGSGAPAAIIGPRGPSWHLGPYADDAAAAAAGARLASGLLEGHTYLNTTSHTFRVYQQAAWGDYDASAQQAVADSGANAAAANGSAQLAAAWATGTLPGGEGTSSAREFAVAAGEANNAAAQHADDAAASLAAVQQVEIASLGILVGGHIFDTNAEMQDKIAAIANGECALVLKDEARDNHITIYRKVAGAMVTRIDATSGEALF